PGHQGHQLRRAAGPAPARARPAGVRGAVSAPRGRDAGDRIGCVTAVTDPSADEGGFLSSLGRSFFSPGRGADPGERFDPARDAGYTDPPPRKGFFTDTSVCIGCKACEVACKEWNAVPEDGIALTGMSYDNTGGLGGSTWRHVAFIEQPIPARPAEEPGRRPESVDLGMPTATLPGADPGRREHADFRWLMESDVCKHCTHAACLDVCP